MKDSAVLAVAGCKGGVGKTTTAINIGAVVARDHTVLVIETDLATANVSDFLELKCNPERDTTLHDVLAEEAAIEDATYEAPGGVHVVPSGATIEGFVAARTDRIGTVVEKVRSQYDLVLLDTPAGVSRETLMPMAIADGVILVATPRLSAIRDVKKTAELVERVGGNAVGLVLTHTGTGNAPPGERLATFLDVKLLGEVPDDQTVPHSQDAGRPVVEFAPSSPPARAYEAIVDRLLNRQAAEQVSGRDQ